MQIQELLIKKRIVIKAVVLKSNSFSSSYGKVNEYIFPDTPLFMEYAYKQGTTVVIAYRIQNDGNKIHTAIVQPEFEVVLIDDTLPEIKELIDNVTLNNLNYFLPHGFFIGSDPEMFVENSKTGIVIPAFNFLGSKAKPNLTDAKLTPYGNKPLYWDGFQAEFETQAIGCLGWHCDSVYSGLKGLHTHALAYDKDAKLSFKTVMDIPQEMLDSAKEEHVAFGCMPSKNAYGMQGVSGLARETTYRSAGGHIHFGIGKQTEEEYIKRVKALDAILGVACVALFQSFDNPRRRQMYGLAGEYRTPAHGLEYRVLSNAWLFHPLIMNLVFDLSRKALVFGANNYMKYWKASEEETIETINTCNVEKAKELLLRNKEVMFKLFEACYGMSNGIVVYEKLLNVFVNGMETIIKDPTNIVDNWKLNGEYITHSAAAGHSFGDARKQLVENDKVA